MQKGFALPLVLVGILLLSLIGAGGYYFYQANAKDSRNVSSPQTSPNPQVKDGTANWETYTSAQYGFTLKHPVDIQVEENHPNSESTHMVGLSSVHIDNYIPLLIFVGKTSVERNTPKKIVDIMIKQDKSSIGYVLDHSRSDYILGKIAGEKLVTDIADSSGRDYGNVRAVVVKGDKEYELVISYRAADKEKTLKKFDEILSTFRFLDDETANWKTYTNKKYNFEIRYPNHWVYQEGNPKDKSFRIWFDFADSKPDDNGNLPGQIVLDVGAVTSGQVTLEKFYPHPDLFKFAKDVNIGGLNIKEVRHSACISQGECVTVIFADKNNLYEMEPNVDSKTKEYLEIIYKMLKGFRSL